MRLIDDPDYRRGYAHAVDHDVYYSFMSADDLIRLSKIYKSLNSSYADGLEFYCYELACLKGAILSDPDTSASHRCLVSQGLR